MQVYLLWEDLEDAGVGRVEAVYSDRELAEEALAARDNTWKTWSIEEHEVVWRIVPMSIDGTPQTLYGCPVVYLEQPPPSSRAIEHLRRLLGAGYEHAVGDCDDRHCFHCGEWLDQDKYNHPQMRDRQVWDSLPDRHAADCPYVAAAAFVEALSTSTGDAPPR